MSYQQLLVISNQSFNALTAAEQVLFSALQGLANRGSAGFGAQGVYCVANNFNGITFQPLAADLWLQQLGIPQVAVDDPWTLVSSPSTIKNYILFDLKANPDSANVASSLAGVLNALPVDVSLQSKAEQLGLVQAKDVRTWTVASLLTNYPGKFNKDFAVELNSGFGAGTGIGWGPRDFAVANSAVVFFGKPERDTVMGQLSPCSAIYGWGPTTSAEGEKQFILEVSKAGNYYVAADQAFNLSVFSNLAESSLPVKGAEAGGNRVVEGKCVAFIVSDGDNLQWLLNRGNYDGWWGSPVRGTIPLGWTMSPLLYQLAPSVWNYYVGSLTGQDEIVCGPSGIGYVYDDIAASPSFPDFLAKTNAFMAAASIKAVDIFGLKYPNQDYLKGFTGQAAVEGVFYTSYSPWVVPPNPTNLLYQGKPVVPNTIDLSGNAQQAAQQILEDANKSATYAVYVNAWGNDNRPLETVQLMCQLLAGQPGISIVTPSQLLERARSLALTAGQTTGTEGQVGSTKP